MIFSRELDRDEKVVVIIRKHWLIFFLHTLLFAGVALLPLVAYSFTPPQIIETIQVLVPGSVALFIYLLMVLFLWLLVFIDFTTYHLDVWIVTNRRIIDINQKTLFARDTITLMLEKIQDATVEVRGLMATLFNYGTLIIHTAGENPDIVIRYAANPQYAKDKILEVERIASSRRGSSDGIS
jgi:hypothetical protein